MNHENIRAFFQSSPVAGTPLGGSRGAGGGQAVRLVAQMVAEARRNASGQVVQSRTGNLANSVVGIHHPDPRGGDTVIGVGTTVEYGKWLEEGAPKHLITPQVPIQFIGGRRVGYLLKSKPGHPNPLRAPQMAVNHPGVPVPYRWLHKAVFSVMRRTPL